MAVAAPESIQTAINNNPQGTTFCLSGHFKVDTTIKPKAGNSFIGPAKIEGTYPLDRYDGVEFFGFEGHGINGLRFENLEMFKFEIAIRPGYDAVVRNNYLHHNTRTGAGCGKCDGHVLENNELALNGSNEWLGMSSSGYKTTADNVIVRGNYVHDNVGNGMWFDVDANNVVVENNKVLHNTRKGIFYEISGGAAVIRYNVVQENNCAVVIAGCSPQSSGAPGGGIAANSSRYVEIYGNVLGGNAVAGLNFRDDHREFQAPFGIKVYDNKLNGDALLNCRSEWDISCSGNS